jgi:BirA family biotin operon repressor/biotin-[acetyl-CoA-carboxylase] ligase
VVIGVGINIARPADQVAVAPAGSALRPVAPAGLAEAIMGITAGETLEQVVPALVRDLLAFETQGFRAFSPRFAQRDALRGLPVVLSDGTRGTAQGVAADGGLLVQTDSGVRAVTSAEVSVRPC